MPPRRALALAAAALAIAHLATDGFRHLEGGPPRFALFASQWLVAAVAAAGLALAAADLRSVKEARGATPPDDPSHRR